MSWLEVHLMEEIESAGVMAEVEDATNVEDEIEIGNIEINMIEVFWASIQKTIVKHEIILQLII